MMLLRSLLGFAALASTAMAQGIGGGRATPGLTPGEPGQGDHGSGMKGLGGATVDVPCHPSKVQVGVPFTVNVDYQCDVKRPVDVKVDVVNAITKVGYVGQTIPMEFQKGSVSMTLTLPPNAEEPFLWKVMVNPRGEPFPNMLAETGFAASLGTDGTVGACPVFAPRGVDLAPVAVDYARLTDVPTTVAPGGVLAVTVAYSIASTTGGTIVASLMRKGTNTLIAAAGAAAVQGAHTEILNIRVPADTVVEPVYVVATLTPTGKGWEDRLAEDRTYNIALAGRRLLRTEESA